MRLTLSRALIAPILGIALHSSVDAATLNFTFTVDQIGAPGSALTRDTGTGSAPIEAGGSPDGWPDGSFNSGLTGQTGSKYVQLYLNLNTLLGRDRTTDSIKLSDITSFTYYTKQNTANSPLNWALRLYTRDAAENAPWYNYRFDAINPSYNDTDWHLIDANTAGFFKGMQVQGGSYSNLTNTSLSTLIGDYGSENIEFFSFYAGSSGNNAAILSQITGLSFTMANGDIVNIALIPEPGTMALLGAAGIGFLALSRRRRKAA